MIKIISTLLCSLFLCSASGQMPDVWCTMTAEEGDLQIEMTKKAKKAYENGEVLKSGEITWVPVKFHIMAMSNGIGGISEIEIFEQLVKWNEFYLDQEIQFYIDGPTFNRIENTAAYEDPRGTAGSFQLQNAKNQFFGRMNIFIPLNSGDISGVGTSAGYYSPQGDWIVVRKNEIANSSETIIHEAGHFFSLSHVFRGWDFEPYEEAVHGNPAPAFSPGQLRTENQDRQGNCANCSFAGDMLCDTNPDYLLSQNYSSGNCDYNGSIMDPCGVVVEPPKENVMSYFFGCDQVFSEQQKGLISANLNERRQGGSINKNLEPDRIAVVESGLTVVSPLEGEVLAFNNIAHLDWEDVPGATKYVVDVDKFSSFNVQNERFIVDYSGLTLSDLNADDVYYWRVYPFNSTSTGAGWSSTNSFTTGDGTTAVESIAALDTWTLSPNPMTIDSDVLVTLRAKSTFNGLISVKDITGKTMSQTMETLGVGDNTIKINTADLQNGIYIVSITSGDSVSTKKLIVNK